MLCCPSVGFATPAWRTAALAVVMAAWWATEALPIAATAMLPLAAGPLLGIVTVEKAGHGYGSSTIFLILGGCLLALALERWHLHRRIAYTIVTLAGSSARGLCSASWRPRRSSACGIEHLDHADDAAGRGFDRGARRTGPRARRRRAAALLDRRSCSALRTRDHWRPRTLIGTPTNALAWLSCSRPTA